MKILMVSHDFPPTVGGISAHVFELSSAMVARGHTVHVLTRSRREPPGESTIEGIRVHRLSLMGPALFYGLQMHLHIKRLIRLHAIDHVHIHGWGALEGLKPEQYNIAYTNHTSGYLAKVRKRSPRHKWELKRLFGKASAFIAPSRELLEVPFPIEARKTYIPNGVDTGKYAFDPESRDRIRRELGFDEDTRVGILTRRLVPKNGVRYLAEAMALLKEEAISLLLIGDGPERGAIEELLHQNAPGKFRMLGSMQHHEIISYYSAADFAILPSLMEATSISGLEAMASSLPMVGTTVGGIPDLIDDGQTGILCEPAHPESLARALKRLVSLNLQAMGMKARSKAENEFDWLKIADRTLAAYRGD